MTRHSWTLPIAFALGLSLCSAPLLAASDSDRSDCKSEDEGARERTILACGRLASDKKISAKERAVALNNRGNAYQGKSEFSRAIADYTAGLRLDPTIALVYVNRAFAYKDTGEYDRALADANRSIELDPNNAVLFRARGDIYKARGHKAKGDLDSAIANYNEAIHLNPQDPLSYRNRGLVFETKGDSAHATDDYNKALELRAK
jgi:tetratricopeptide (TPR) repeat protein